MKNFLTILFVATLFFACSKPKKEVIVKKIDPKDGVEFFAKRDLNKDDILTEVEFIKYHKKVFKLIDTNHDRRISRAEARVANQEEVFDMFQKNYISTSDTLEIEDERFVEMDSNRTGKVGKDEYRRYYLRNLGKKKALFD